MKNEKEEIVLTGFGVSNNIAIGTAYLVQVEKPIVVQKQLNSVEEVSLEKEKLDKAVEGAKTELNILREKSNNLPGTTSDEVKLLIDAHLAMLSGSRLINSTITRIDTGINAEFALQEEIKALSTQFELMEDSYLSARVDDIESVGNRILRSMMNIPYLSLDDVPQDGIVLANEITPADTALLDPSKFGAIVTVHGGAAGHTAIMANSLGLPAVLGVIGLLDFANNNDEIIVDGENGRIIINPSVNNLKVYQEKVSSQEIKRKKLTKQSQDNPKTKDGVEIKIRANLEVERELGLVKESGADGIGLFRTEFMFMNRSTLPTEEEQFISLSNIVKEMGNKTVTFRTLDIGGDKLAQSMDDYIGKSDNPALGLRAIRLSLKKPEILKTQFKAILRASTFGNVRILLPMVTVVNEVLKAKEILKQAHLELTHGGFDIPRELPKLGVMIEIPAAALTSDSLAQVSDFFALGTNDLTQYTIAIDRGNDQVASLYNPLNPAVLRLIDFTIQAAERYSIPISICGEMASEVNYTKLLLGLGIKELSMGSSSIPYIKENISNLVMSECKEFANKVMSQYDPDVIKDMVEG